MRRCENFLPFAFMLFGNALAGTLMVAGEESAVDSARYVTLGIALLTLLGIFAAGIATRK
ncbi:MAG TPA: hypothetical protein VN150_11290 [Ochrobactrum sp.]|nr:hypothetical protein [Ochrobactrum sp.]